MNSIKDISEICNNLGKRLHKNFILCASVDMPSTEPPLVRENPLTLQLEFSDQVTTPQDKITLAMWRCGITSLGCLFKDHDKFTLPTFSISHRTGIPMENLLPILDDMIVSNDNFNVETLHKDAHYSTYSLRVPL